MPSKRPATSIEVLPIWWASDAVPLECFGAINAHIRFDTGKGMAKGRLVAFLEKAVAEPMPVIGWGGPLRPHVFVSKEEHKVELLIDEIDDSASGSPILLRVEGFDPENGKTILLAEFPQETAEIKVRQALSIPILANGFVDYVAVQTNAKKLRISSLRIVSNGGRTKPTAKPGKK